MSFPIDPLIVDIPGFPGYQISELGAVYNKKTGRELKNGFGSDKRYWRISLYKNGKSQLCHIHRLLALSFIDNLKKKPYVDHIDRNTQNNKLENLRWVNASQNASNIETKTNNSSGHRGVHKRESKENGKVYVNWVALITKNRKNKSQSFPYTEEGLENAKKWYLEKKQELHTYN